MVRRNLMDQDEVKRMTVSALVDTGSYMLCINESIQEQLQTTCCGKTEGETADSRIVELDVVTNVELKFKNRRTLCNYGIKRRF
ncbi:MAG: hypothetical protein IPO37_19960 [Saprospiraceae bacterium]|nr:hypothetical protein [Saprospiraceae bacterium]